ncbi:MAG: apolipoprotein N-acyltransferase [Thermodesulfobacteriota bacterium]
MPRLSRLLPGQDDLLACLGGLGLALAFPSPGLWPLAWLSLVPLLAAIAPATPGRAARLGLMAGLVWHLGLLYWIVIVLGRYGHLPLWVCLPALLLLALYLAAFTALFAALISWAWRRGLAPIWLAPPLWVALDWTKASLFTGFPWDDLAYSQYQQTLLVQVADLTGHRGLTFALVLGNVIVYAAVARPWRTGPRQARMPVAPGWRTGVAAGLVFLAAMLAYDLVRSRQLAASLGDRPFLRVAAIQGNVSQDQKWRPSLQEETVGRYLRLSALAGQDQKPDLVVWPETALPLYPLEHPLFANVRQGVADRSGSWLLTGAPHRQPAEDGVRLDYFNSAFLIDPWGQVSSRYDKVHLVPFGEYMPLSDWLPLPGPLVESVGNFTAGAGASPLPCGKAAVGVLVCFESIFPGLAREQVRQGATLLATITNDAWFGRSSAPWQHLSMAVLRAVETRRSLARAANTGVSALIDPLGRLLDTTPLFTEGYLVANLPVLDEETAYVRHGELFSALCVVAVLCSLLRLRTVPERPGRLP